MAKKDDRSILGVFLGIIAIYAFWLSFSQYQIGKLDSSVVAFLFGIFLFFISYKTISG